MPAELRPPPPPKRLPPPTTFQLMQRWVTQHRALTAAAVAFVVTGSLGALVYIKNKEQRRKRRAKKSPSGARTEVVVVAGAVANPLASALYLDLERRGFVVYVVAHTSEDDHYIRSQSRADLLPLHVDLIDPYTAQEQLARFRNLLAREHRAFDEAEPHKLRFAGFILVPDTESTPTRIEDLSSEEWSNALNAKVLNTIATAQLFLPSITEHKAKIVLLTPSVTPSLTPPLHAIESTVYGALKGFVSSLDSEMREECVAVSHFKLGNIDIPSVTARNRRDGVPQSRFKATPLRRLHDNVFDALISTRPRRTWHVGRGSLAYDIIGTWVPAGAVGWLMGAGRRPNVVEELKDDELQGNAGSLTWEKIEQET